MPRCAKASRYAHARGAKVLMALNTFADAREPERWWRAVDRRGRRSAPTR
jgi:collagenase-like PrtC family protease